MSQHLARSNPKKLKLKDNYHLAKVNWFLKMYEVEWVEAQFKSHEPRWMIKLYIGSSDQTFP